MSGTLTFGRSDRGLDDMTILGISAFYHDSAACVLRDGRLVAAAQEERFTRVKHDASFPEAAIRSCLAQAGIEPSGIDEVAFYEKPLAKLDRVMETAAAVAPRGLRSFASRLPAWFTEKARLPDLLRRRLGYRGPILYCEHHESHAASSFFPSPFEEAAILTVDGVGEWATNTVGVGRGGRVELLQELLFPHSLGLLYSAFTEFLGFAVNSDEYKVMGLAPFGEPRYVDRILERLLDLKEDGSYRLDLSFFAFLEGERTVNSRFADLFGLPPRRPEAAIRPADMDLARSIQAVTDEVLLRQARHAHRLTGLKNLCLAGGVALNCVTNGRILREGPFSRVWIQPAAGDAGGCIGAAYVAWHHVQGQPRIADPRDAMEGALLGPGIGGDEAEEALARSGIPGRRLDDDALFDAVTGLLADGKVVGWCRGRMEFGPRALGHRSILADPRRPDMQRRVNEKIKFREGFRPFAPAVLRERVTEWFDLDTDSPYMLLVAEVARSKRVARDPGSPEPEGLDRLHVARSVIPAVTHVDGSARVQTVSADVDPDFHRLLRSFEARTGCPVLLNTSFNLRGEPIVRTPGDACRTFRACHLDALVVDSWLVERPEGLPIVPLPPPRPGADAATPKRLRRFGLELSAGLLAAAGLTLWAWESPRAALGLAIAATLLAVFAWVRPSGLAAVERPWMRTVRVVAGGLSFLLTAVVHLALVTPIGLIRRAFRPDPLGLRPDRARSSWWSARVARAPDPESYRHPF